jgi:hypothetical protein
MTRYDKPCVDRKVRSMNPRIDWAVLGCGKSHIHVIETTSFQREDCHLNLHGKKKLTLLITNSLDDKNVSGTSSIPVITSGKASPSLA